jgi:SAM-dependent methyltransferase
MTTTVLQALKACAICKTAAHVEEILKVFDERTEQHEKLLKCKKCQLVYVNEPIRQNISLDNSLDEAALRKEWTEKFPETIDAYASDAWGETYQNRQEIMQWQYEAVADLLGADIKTAPLTLVEMGTARGYLLAEIGKHHPQMKLIGVEPSPIMAKYAQATGARIVNGIVEDANFEKATLDAVVAFGCFIQVRDPLATLLTLNRAVKPGGKLLLDSPNGDSLFRTILRSLNHQRRLLKSIGVESVFESAYRLAFNPGRFYFYSPHTYTKLLDLAGFKVTKIKLRQPRSVKYGTATRSSYVGAMMQAVSLAERVTNRQSWVEVHAVKYRECTQ